MVIKSECPLSPGSSLCVGAFLGLAVVTRHPGGQAGLLLSLPAAPQSWQLGLPPLPTPPPPPPGPLCCCPWSCPLSVIKSSSVSPRSHSSALSHAALTNGPTHSLTLTSPLTFLVTHIKATHTDMHSYSNDKMHFNVSACKKLKQSWNTSCMWMSLDGCTRLHAVIILDLNPLNLVDLQVVQSLQTHILNSKLSSQSFQRYQIC